MIERRELITISRQIGSMMEAGVDILRITRVLRAQTDDPEILRAFDTLDHGLRMGIGMADAMEKVPALFSPFAVSLVRQGEARNDIPGAFHKIADFWQKEDEADVLHESGTVSTPDLPSSTTVTPSTLLPLWVLDDLIHRAQLGVLRLLTLAAGLLLALAAVWGSVEAGFIERRWQNVLLCSVAALFLGGAGVWLRRRIEAEYAQEIERRKTLETQAAPTAGETSSFPAGQQDQLKATPAVVERKNSAAEATFD